MSEPEEDYADFLDLMQGRPHQGWRVQDDTSADYALRRIGMLEARKRTRAAFVAAEIERLKTWHEHADKRAQQGIDFFTGALRSYYDGLKADGVLGKSKTYALPHGKLRERRMPLEYDGQDAEELFEWVTSHASDYVRIKVDVDWSELKPHVRPVQDQAFSECIYEPTGEVIPGLRVKQPNRDVFSVKPEVDSWPT